jgi:polyisoprenyl-phosphate glycosyltransferase
LVWQRDNKYIEAWMKKKISIVAGCYNEEENIQELYARITKVMMLHAEYDYEIILIDNASSDETVNVIKRIAAEDGHLKAIVNVRNFGHIRSGYYAFLDATGDAVITMASDLEDPPELISSFITEWERGYKIAIGVRKKSDEGGVMPYFRKAYYALMKRISDIDHISNFTGFGLYDRKVMELLREYRDPYPYFRGVICDLGFPRAEVPFEKIQRKRGVSKGNFFVYFDLALLGIVNSSKAPLRLATIFGICMSVLSFVIGIYYIIEKILNWENFQMGIAPLGIGLFFMMGVLFFLVGIIGEYIGLILTHTVKRPMVVEQERINYDG